MSFWEFIQEENAVFVSDERRAFMELLHGARYELPVVYRTWNYGMVRTALNAIPTSTSVRNAIIHLESSASCEGIIRDGLARWKDMELESMDIKRGRMKQIPSILCGGSIPQSHSDYRFNVGNYFCATISGLQYEEEDVLELVSDYNALAQMYVRSKHGDEAVSEIIECMVDVLNEIAPNGLFFGTHPDDGADWGWWAVDTGE